MTSKTTTDLIARGKELLKAEWKRVRSDTFRALLWILALTAFGALVETTGVSFRRLTYPYTLEWMEGGVVDHARVVLEGRPMYVKPSFAWTPYIYTPLYYWVTAAFMKVFGVSLTSARLVSVASMMGCFGMIFQHVRREVGGYVAPIVGAALFAATFKVTGYWIDLARVDALFFLLILVAIYVGRHAKGYVGAAISGLLFTAAFFTKQSGILLAAPAIGGFVLISWRRGLVTAAAFGVSLVAAIAWMNHASDGWFTYYVFTVPGKHFVDTKNWHEFTLKAVWRPMPFAVALALFSFLMGAFGDKKRAVALMWAGLLLGSWVHGASGLAHVGGSDNAVIPSCGILGVLAGIGLQWIFAHPGEGELTTRLKCFTALAVMLQLTVLSYDPRECLPKKSDVRAGNEMIARLGKLKGPMYSFGFGYYLSRIDRPEIHAHSMAMVDVFRAEDPVMNKELLEDIRKHVRSQEFAVIVWDVSMQMLPIEIKQALDQNYRWVSALYDTDAGYPKTAYGARPGDAWLSNGGSH